jgi:hypothetical protein
MNSRGSVGVQKNMLVFELPDIWTMLKVLLKRIATLDR